MKRFCIAVFVLAMIFFVSFMARQPGQVEGQAPYSLDRLVSNGILYPDASRYSVMFDDFLQFPQAVMWDTTSVVTDAGSIVAIVDSMNTSSVLKLSLGTASKGIGNGMNIQTTNAPFMLVGSPSNTDMKLSHLLGGNA